MKTRSNLVCETFLRKLTHFIFIEFVLYFTKVLYVYTRSVCDEFSFFSFKIIFLIFKFYLATSNSFCININSLNTIKTEKFVIFFITCCFPDQFQPVFEMFVFDNASALLLFIYHLFFSELKLFLYFVVNMYKYLFVGLDKMSIDFFGDNKLVITS